MRSGLGSSQTAAFTRSAYSNRVLAGRRRSTKHHSDHLSFGESVQNGLLRHQRGAGGELKRVWMVFDDGV